MAAALCASSSAGGIASAAAGGTAEGSNGTEALPQRCCVLVMEFCGYGTLLNALRMDAFKNRDGSPNMSLICSVLLEIASALQYTHAYGIIHCDIKPQNVLLKPDDSNPRGFVTKLADFGLARVVTQAIPLLNGDSAGTPSHLAPEIVKFGDQESIKTAKADIYALGILVWRSQQRSCGPCRSTRQPAMTRLLWMAPDLCSSRRILSRSRLMADQ
jgi:serine/threonine protein kinase